VTFSGRSRGTPHDDCDCDCRDERQMDVLRDLARRCDAIPAQTEAAARTAFEATPRPITTTGASPMSQPTETDAPADPSAVPYQRPLTLVMALKPGAGPALRDILEHGLELRAAIEAALTRVGTVHFARFVLLENDTRLAVITTYDDDFDDYIMDFVDELGPVFDKLLQFVGDAPALPVQANRDAFLKYVKCHDLTCIGSFYSAYPTLGVSAIVDR